MEFRQLRYFLAVAEHLHFTAAAESLGIAQPPLSQQIMKLEKEIGTQLFIRHPRRVELTDAGAIFKDRARRILHEADDALEQVRKAARGETGQLVIGFAGSTVFHPWVATTLRRFQQRYPGVRVKTEESNSTALLGKIAEGSVDCAMVRMPLDCGELKTAALAEEEMIAVLPTGHRFGKLRSIDLAQLAADPFVLFPRAIGPDLYDSILAACRAAGFAPQIQMESPQISSTINMVAAGFGVTVIPASIRQVQANGVIYLKLRNRTLRTTISLAYRPREKLVTVKHFVDVLREIARQAPST